MYVYSRSFTIESDHKPQESISQKNLADTPAHLQHMLLHLQGYDYTIHYHPSQEMALPNTLSWFSPCPGPNIPLDIAIHHAHLSPERKEAFQQAFVSNLEMHALANMIITGWPNDIKVVPCPLHPYWQHWEPLMVEDGLVLCGEALIIPPSERERILRQLHQFHQGTAKAKLFTCGCVFWPGINKAIEEAVCQCETCTKFQAQNAAGPCTPMQTPSHPWQLCAMDIFTLEGINYLICGTFYSKMILIQCFPSSQSNTVKVVSLLKEMFSEHGIPKVLCSNNGPQYVSVQFTEFCTSWGITHKTSSPHYPQWNGFTEACIKSMKHALQCAKYSSADPQLALLVLQATPINTKLPSPAELLYQHKIRTTIPARICNTDLAALRIHERIDACSNASKSQADKWCKSLAPLYASQPIVMYDTLHKIWIPATVVCVLPKDSYQVQTSNGMVYCHMRQHLHECSVKPTDTAPAVTIATLQAPARPCISAPLPAPHKPAQLLQNLPVAPATTVTPKPQTPAAPKSPLCLHLCLQHPV